MTYQQTQDASPLVYEMKFIAAEEIPEIVRTNRTFLDTDHNVVITGNHHMYAVTNIIDNSSSPGRITKFTRQDFHEHYFVTNDISLGSGAMLYYHYTVSGTSYPPKTKIQYLNDYIYVMSLSNLSGGEADFRMEQFSIVSPPYLEAGPGGTDYLVNDLSLNWRTVSLGEQIRYFQPERYDNHDLFGFVSPSGDDYVWAYYYDYSLNSSGTSTYQHIMIHKFDSVTGVLDNSIAIEGIHTGVSNTVNGVIIDKPSSVNGDLAVTLNTTNGGIQLGHVDIADGVDVSIGDTQAITTERTIMPITHTVTASGGLVNTMVVYVEIDNDLNKISFADSTTAISSGSGSDVEYFSRPYRYRIDKATRFDETFDVNQEQYNFTVAQNPLNPKFFYIGYITSDNHIRVIKLYRHLPSTQDNYEYILMWATMSNETQSPFMDASGDFTVSYAVKNSLHMVTDDCGDLYVFCRKGEEGEGYLRVWKIREYVLNFGQDELGITLSYDPTLFPDFLATITDNYTVLSMESSFFAEAGLPHIGDVIVSNVTQSGDDYHITFKYINYDAFQTLDLLDSGLTVAESFNEDLITVLEQIYGTDTGIAPLNFDSVKQIIYNGTQKTVTVVISTNSLIKPCVVEGTEITVHDQRTGQPKLIPVEKVKVGDRVYNQWAQPVRVTAHTYDRVVCDQWTAPHVIPVHYFGINQPYRTLFISGDHGIRMTRSNGQTYRIYPCNMKGAFRRIRVGTAIHYHHLKLENTRDFYMANGLLVESIRKE